MIKDYSILFRGMSDGTTKFHYSLNSNTAKSIIMKVYNQYLEYVEYESAITLQPDVNYWTSVPSNNKGRYVEFRDANTLEIVGMFGLNGEIDYDNIPYSSYIKSIVPSLDYNGKKDMHYILNEIFYQKVYNNDFVCVAENDIVFDIGFNYGFFTLDALTYKPKKADIKLTLGYGNITTGSYGSVKSSTSDFSVEPSSCEVYSGKSCQGPMGSLCEA